MAEEFYKNARAYDIAFQDRDFDVECDFMEWCVNKHGKAGKDKMKNKSFIELASGPARHAREMVKRGWQSTALDLSPSMVAFAASEAKRENIKMNTIVGDMAKFNTRKKYTLAATLMESISHLTTNEQMISHFKSIAKCLAPGGVYVLEATHPMFFFPDDEANTWTCKADDLEVEVTFGMPSDKYNSVTQVWDVTTRMRIWEGNNPVRVEQQVSPVRWYLAQEMKALVELSGAFDKYWIYGSSYYIPPQELDDTEDSDAMVFVMRKK